LFNINLIIHFKFNDFTKYLILIIFMHNLLKVINYN